MRSTPVGQKWIIKYQDKDGKQGMGMTDHYSKLPFCIQLLSEKEVTNLTITDETFYKDEE